jgi:ankyrin repeat protein
MQSFLADDHVAVDKLLSRHDELKQHVNVGAFDWNMPALGAAKSKEMVDVLISHGASVEKLSAWWAPGFGADQVDRKMACYLVSKGAKLTIHAATHIGMTDEVTKMLDDEPDLVRARGGDGCHPLHFCKDAELLSLLIERGAELEARDEDHFSTPAQWRIQDSPDIVRLLLRHGAAADIFMAAGLGDLELAIQLVAEDPACTEYRIGNNKGPFPGIGYRERGGTIYQWSLGFNLSPHEVALRRGRQDIYDFILKASSPKAKFLVACTTANRPLAESVVADQPDIVRQLDEEDLALMAKFCWETNKNIEAVRLMLDMGFLVDAREFNHGCTALHNAAWCGDPELVRLLLERGHPCDVRDPDHQSTPIDWAVHSCTEAKRHADGRFPEVVKLLLEAGTSFDKKFYPVGDKGIDAVLKKHLKW